MAKAIGEEIKKSLMAVAKTKKSQPKSKPSEVIKEKEKDEVKTVEEEETVKVEEKMETD